MSSGVDERPASTAGPVRRELIGALLVYVFLAYLLTASAWTSPTNRWPGICCDQEQSIWFLSWLPHALATGQNPLLTDRLNAPAGANLMWNAADPLVALVVSPITLTAGPILAYDVAVVLGIALSGLAAFAALRRLGARAPGALVGGGLYALSPFVASHAVLHLNLVMAFGPPLFLILFDELVARRRYRPELLGVGVGVLAAVQLLTFEEILATSAVTAAILAAVLAIVVRDAARIREAARRILRAAIPALATFLVLAAFPLAVQFLGPQQLHGRVQDPAAYSTDLLNLVLPTSYQLIAPTAATDISRHFSGLFHEATAYVGLPLLLVLGGVVVLLRRDRRVIVAAAIAVVMFVLSLGPELHVGGTSWHVPMPWLPFSLLPLLEHATPGRLTVFMWLAIAVLVALGIDRALEVARPRAAVVRLGAISLALLFVVPAPLPAWSETIPPFFTTWDGQGVSDQDIVLFAPWFYDGAGADPMLWAAYADARPRMLEGYVYVPGPSGRPQYGPSGGILARTMMDVQDHGATGQPSAANRQALLRQLVDGQVSVVIVGPMPHRDLMVAFFTDLLAAPPTQSDGVQVWSDVQDLVARQSGG